MAEGSLPPGRPLSKAQPGHRSYNLNERRRIGSMTGMEQAQYQKVPTDESEALTLASADLDYMKSKEGRREAQRPLGPGSLGLGCIAGRSCLGLLGWEPFQEENSGVSRTLE